MLKFCTVILGKYIYFTYRIKREPMTYFSIFDNLINNELTCCWDSNQEDGDIQKLLFPCCDIYYSNNF